MLAGGFFFAKSNRIQYNRYNNKSKWIRQTKGKSNDYKEDDRN